MRNQCTFQKEVERWFDGEVESAAAVGSHLESCVSCTAHVAFLTECRDAIASLPAGPEIADGQMPAFLEGIAEGVQRPRRRSTGFWAMTSAVTAAVIVAVSALTIFSPGAPPAVAGSEVEVVSTDIDGATVEIIDGDSATPGIWLNLPEGGEF